MSSFVFITGPAGVGKTHELMESVVRWYQENGLKAHQKVQICTIMHGARRRLLQKVKERCPSIACNIATIDSFALEIANRWRKSFGIERPIFPIQETECQSFDNDLIGCRGNFDLIAEVTANVLSSASVCRYIADTYPLIVIDEFQDCHGERLNIIKHLKGYTNFIVAADPFQSLNCNEDAIDWINSLGDKVNVIRLEKSMRTNVKKIINTSNALFYNEKAVSEIIHYEWIATYSLLAWKIMPDRTMGSHALIAPAERIFKSLFANYKLQIERRKEKGKGTPPNVWKHIAKSKDIASEIKEMLTNQKRASPSSRTISILAALSNIARLRGIEVENEVLVDFLALSYAQKKRAFSPPSLKYEATTIHGAKNREFENVIVIWDYNIVKKFSDEQKRRLLYNAITRAKISCKLFIIGNMKDIEACSALSLLGKPLVTQTPKKMRPTAGR